jgi:hypothetical protein
MKSPYLILWESCRCGASICGGKKQPWLLPLMEYLGRSKIFHVVSKKIPLPYTRLNSMLTQCHKEMEWYADLKISKIKLNHQAPWRICGRRLTNGWTSSQEQMHMHQLAVNWIQYKYSNWSLFDFYINAFILR